MSAEAKTTTNRQEIQAWVEERGGHPARVKDTEVLRIDYPGYSGEDTLEEISWDDFFETFEASNLAFLYQEETKDGELSRFSKLVSREKEKGSAAGK
ncbi:MAG TPA: hypothetical protein VHR36_12660 [Pyrinomonadaceae bacterium]|jgi:hypothetical protein|nr:hypothetical protein [Pyrinomonadaceae bacterium]